MSSDSPGSTPSADLSQQDREALAKVKEAHGNLRRELSKVIVGQDEVIEQLLVAIFSQGHCLLEGVPGLAKTLLVSSLARSLRLDFSRIQFTPDLMPSDITGTEVIQENKATGERAFRFLNGPVFANIVLADEVNRTPPKTQAALLEAMQERQVTIGGESYSIPSPFFVLATEYVTEPEGRHTLPEAQQDRFMFKVFVRYPSYDEEFVIAETTTAHFSPQIEQVLSGEEILRLQELVRRVPLAPHVIHYALRLVRATRVHEGEAPDFVRDTVSWGSGPRGMQFLLLGGKARAVLAGRPFVTIEDIRAVAHPVLRHRIITNFNAESSGVTPDAVVDRLIKHIPERRDGDDVAPSVARAFA